MKTVVALFTNSRECELAARHLDNLGISPDSIEVVHSKSAADPGAAAYLAGAGIVRADVGGYLEELRRGAALVIVRAPEDSAGRVADELDRLGALPLHTAPPPSMPPGFAPFREGVLEFVEITEEPVVTAEPWVVEELVVRKETQDRTEIIRDSVRKTEVEAERLPESPRR